MSEHASEYQELLAKAAARDQSAIEAHWELGTLFARYGESVTDIAQAIDRSVSYVSDHIRIAKAIPSTEALAEVLANRDDISTWTILVDWVKSDGPGENEPGGGDAGENYKQKKRRREATAMDLSVPAHIIKGLADAGCNAREVMTNFWANVTPNLLISVAYPDRVGRRLQQTIAEAEDRLASDEPMTTLEQLI
jgi:hypothetical protein